MWMITSRMLNGLGGISPSSPQNVEHGHIFITRRNSIGLCGYFCLISIIVERYVRPVIRPETPYTNTKSINSKAMLSDR